MQDKEFFDGMYWLFTKTTRASDAYWKPEEDPDDPGFRVWAVDKEDSHTLIAKGMEAADAEWLCALHGCFPDLIRYLLSVTDEAERLDIEKDSLTNELMQLALELDRYK